METDSSNDILKIEGNLIIILYILIFYHYFYNYIILFLLKEL